MKRILLLAGLMLGAVASPAMAQPAPGDWVEIMRGDNGPVFMDRSSIMRNGDIVVVRSRADLIQAMENGTKTMYTRFQLNCAARTADLLAILFLDAGGRTLRAATVPDGERRVEPIGPGSPNERMAALLCGGAGGRG